MFYFGAVPNQHTLAALEQAMMNLPSGRQLFLLREERDTQGDHDDTWLTLIRCGPMTKRLLVVALLFCSSLSFGNSLCPFLC